MSHSTSAHDIFRVLARYRTVSLIVFSAVLGIAVGYVLIATPVYRASVQLLMEADSPNVLAFKGVIDEAAGRNDYYQTQHQMLRTRAIARATIARLDLWNHPELAPPAAGPSVLRAALVPFRRRSAERGTPPAAPPTETVEQSTETVEQSRAVDGFLRRLTVTPIRQSRLITVSFDSVDPALAARVANTLTTAYIDEHLRFRRIASKDASEWLTIQLALQRRRVEAADTAAQRYREQHGVPATDEPHVLVQRIADLNQALTRAKTTRFEKESVYRELVALGTSRTIEAAPVVAASTVIQNLQRQLMALRQEEAGLAEQLGDRHPDLIRLRATIQDREDELNAEISRKVDGARAELAIAAAQEGRLEQALAAQRQSALALGQRGIEFGVLQQEATGARALFEALLQRTKEADMVGQLGTTNIRVVDAAPVPVDPAFPRSWLILVVGLFAASTLALAIPFGLNALDDRVRGPEDLAELGLPFLGLVPSVGRPRSSRDRPLLNNLAPEAFAEAVRNLSANLRMAPQLATNRTVLFTSAGSAEGKSTMASNVAVALAGHGQRVLLVDADMRDPRQHQFFRQPLEPGLGNLLVNRLALSAVMRPTTVPNLLVVSAGWSHASPTDLLAAGRLGGTLREAAAVFDWVIVDSPPAIAFADASVLARSVSMVVLVVDAGRTSRESVRATLSSLRLTTQSATAAVLNRVDLRHDLSPYGRAYRRAYRRA
jgi:capsular exopolysaccharide synthesis family protein